MYCMILFRYRADASVVHFLVRITVLLLVLWRITRRTLVSGISTTRLVLGVISAKVENFGFDSLKNMDHDMDCWPRMSPS